MRRFQVRIEQACNATCLVVYQRAAAAGDYGDYEPFYSMGMERLTVEDVQRISRMAAAGDAEGLDAFWRISR